MIYRVKNWHVLATKKTAMFDKDLLVMINRPNLYKKMLSSKQFVNESA